MMLAVNAFHRLTAEQYHRDPCETPSLSSSIAKRILDESPKHAYLAHPRLGGHRWDPTSSQDTGSLIHALMLGKGAPIAVIDAKDFKSKAAQEARDEAKAAGKLPVTEPAFLKLRSVATTLLTTLSEEYGIRLIGESELAAIWEDSTDDGTPVLCRGMLDHLVGSRGLVYDIKTISSAHPDKCSRQMSEYGYDVQWAAYTSALRTIQPSFAGREDFVFLFCEIEPPYCVTPVRPSGEFRHLGEMRWARAKRTWAECLRTGKWPGYATSIINVEPPPWALTRELGNVA